MRRSSTMLCLISLLAAAPALGRPLIMHAGVPGGAIRTVHPGRPMIGRVGLAHSRIVRPQVRLAGRPGRLFRGNGLGVFGPDLGLSLAGDFAPLPDAGEGPEFAPGAPDAVPPPCVRPRIIRIGAGLRHRPKTRVVYGLPYACVR